MTRIIIRIFFFVFLFVLLSYIGAAMLCHGLHKTYGLNKNSDILIIGHSHIMLALNHEMMENELKLNVSKYTREGVTIFERKLMAEHYLSLQKEKLNLKVVLLGVDPYLFKSDGLSKNSYINFYPFMDNDEIRDYIRSNAPAQDYWRNFLFPLCRYSDAAINAGVSGLCGRGGQSMTIRKVDVEHVKNAKQQRSISIESDAVKTFCDTVDVFTRRGIHVILLNTPIIDIFNHQEPEKHRQVEDIYMSLAQDNPLVEYWDLSPKYESQYDLFMDPIHLNRDGQKAITEEIIKKLSLSKNLF